MRSTLQDDGVKLAVIKLDATGSTQQQIEMATGVPSSSVGDFLRRSTYKAFWTLYDNNTDVVLDNKTVYTGSNAKDKVSQEDKLYLEKYNAKQGNFHIEAQKEYDNSRILFISDMHAPYNHPDTIKYLAWLKDKYAPTRIICGGDEADKHALSFHDSDPDLMSAGDELRAGTAVLLEVHKLFPEMSLVDSNHGSLVWRKAKAKGIPKAYIKSYQDVLGITDGWTWHFDLTVELPNGQHVYVTHGKVADVTKLSQTMGMNAVQFHYHEKYKLEYWANPTGLYFAMQCGCLIDDTNLAFAYNNANLKRPIIGTGLIIDSKPVLEPMVLDTDGRWVGRYGWYDDADS